MAKLQVYDTSGKQVENMTVSDALVLAQENKALMAQAIRVYLSNQRHALPQVRTKSDLAFTTAKMYRQKGTGRARHGSKKAAQFVGGKKAHGPAGTQDFGLRLNKKMRRAAISQALSWHYHQQSLWVVKDLSKIDQKAKAAAQILEAVCQYPQRKKVVVVLEDTKQPIIKAAANLEGVQLTQAARVNYYELLNHDAVIMTQKAMMMLDRLAASQQQVADAEKKVK